MIKNYKFIDASTKALARLTATAERCKIPGTCPPKKHILSQRGSLRRTPHHSRRCVGGSLVVKGAVTVGD